MESLIHEPVKNRDAATRAGLGDDLPETIISPSSAWRLPDLGELWRCSDLIYYLAWRDVKVRYRQTVLGIAWAVLQPTLMMIVMAAVFGGLGGANSGSTPYPIFLFAGLLPWTFFASAVTGAAGSIVASESLIKKVYFPRLAIPLSAVCVAIVDFLVALSVLAILMIWYQTPLGASLIFAPLVMGALVLAGLGIGSLIAALNVAYRDFRYVVGFLVQLWMFATPAIYFDYQQPAAIPTAAANQDIDASKTNPPQSEVRWMARINPINGLIQAFRAAVLGRPMPWAELGYSFCVTLLVGATGMLYFARVEDQFADIV